MLSNKEADRTISHSPLQTIYSITFFYSATVRQRNYINFYYIQNGAIKLYKTHLHESIRQLIVSKMIIIWGE